MALGGVLFLIDQSPAPRNWHVFLIPSLFLMGIGALLATVNAIANRRAPESRAAASSVSIASRAIHERSSSQTTHERESSKRERSTSASRRIASARSSSQTTRER